MPPNDDLIARETSLPGFALMLDDAALAEALGEPSFMRGRMRYKPGVSCTLAVRLSAGRWRCLRALTPARFAEAHAKAPRDTPSTLAAHAILVLQPGRDRKIPGLRRFWPSEKRSKALSALFGEGHLALADVQPISYRPERRMVARLCHPFGDGLLKIHSPKAFAQAQSGALIASALGHGTVKALSPRDHALASDWLPGTSLRPRDGDPDMVRAFSEAGAALARVHASTLSVPFRRTRYDETAFLTAIAPDTAALIPALGPRLHAAADGIVACLAGLPTDYGLRHGDFSADQVVLNPSGTVTLIDWDRACMGDRAGDLGSALARLELDALSGLASPKTCRLARKGLLAGYTEIRTLPLAVDAQRLVHLFLLLTDPFRRQTPDWPAVVTALLERVEAGLSRASAGPLDSALPGLADILQPAGAQRALSGIGQARLEGVPRLVRHKPGRRALVQIRARLSDGARHDFLVKLRARKPDHVTPRLHCDLRAAGFNGRSDRAFAVPRAYPGPDGTRSWMMDLVPGTELSVLQSPENSSAPFEQAGRALGALHAARPRLARVWTPQNEMGVLDRALAQAKARHPSCAARVDALRDRVSASAPQAKRPPVLLHRDFYPDQLLVDRDRVWMLDLDLAAWGDRHVDLGNFLAHLDEYGMRRFGDAAALERHGQAFLSGYRASGHKFEHRELSRLRQISLLRHLDICARFTARANLFPTYLAHLEQVPAFGAVTEPEHSDTRTAYQA